MKKILNFILCAIIMFGILPDVVKASNTMFAIEPQYDRADSFSDGLARVIRDGKWGYIDKTGKEFAQQYDFVYDFSEGLGLVEKDGKYGFVDKTGKEVLAPQYDEADPFSEGLALVVKDGKYGYIDKTGKVVIAQRYASYFSEGLAMDWNVSVKKYGFIDKTGKVVIAPQYDEADSFSEGLAAVGKNGKEGYIDQTGKEVIALQYDFAYSFSEGLGLVRTKDFKYGYIDKTGKEVIAKQFDRSYGFSEGLAAVKKGGKWGYIDQTGKEVIALQYDEADSFSEGLAEVKKDGKWGFIDKTGKEVIALQYDETSSFSEGLAAVRKEEKWGYIANPLSQTKKSEGNNIGNSADTISEWAKQEVDEAIKLGLVPNEFQHGYQQPITRAEFSLMIVEMLKKSTGQTVEELIAASGKEINPFLFIDTTDAVILLANNLGIVNGKGKGIFDPNGNITRQEAAVMLARTAKFLNIQEGAYAQFADQGQIADWAKDAVGYTSSLKDPSNNTSVMGGTGNNNFSPKDNYTRQQTYITIKRLFNAKMKN